MKYLFFKQLSTKLRIGQIQRKRTINSDALIFYRLRRRFMLLTMSVLGTAFFILFALVAWFVPLTFTHTISVDLTAQADRLQHYWQDHPQQVCPLPSNLSTMVACFDAQGRLLRSAGAENDNVFLSNNLALSVLHNNPEARQNDEVRVPGVTSNPLWRQARLVTDPQTQKVLGVIQVGEWMNLPSRFTLVVLSALLLCIMLIGTPLISFFLAHQAIKPIRQAFQHQQDFIANASHELRTPLALLRADAEVLLRCAKNLSEEDQELLTDIVTEASHMTRLANTMLSLARLDSGQMQLEHDILELDKLVVNIARRMQTLASKQAVNIIVDQLSIKSESSKSAFAMIGDRTLIEQVIMIILDNAIRYNRKEGIVTVSLSRQIDKKKTLLALKITDTGIGIPSSHLAHLGKRFYRVDKARSRESGGNGLGLSIARSIITAHQGSLTFESQEGAGTTVTIHFPVTAS